MSRDNSNVVNSGAYLNPCEPKNASFLALQPFVNLVGVVTIDIRFCHEGKRWILRFPCADFILELAYGCVIPRLLTTELRTRDSFC
jgi:hypothetical protein